MKNSSFGFLSDLFVCRLKLNVLFLRLVSSLQRVLDYF